MSSTRLNTNLKASNKSVDNNTNKKCACIVPYPCSLTSHDRRKHVDPIRSIFGTVRTVSAILERRQEVEFN